MSLRPEAKKRLLLLAAIIVSVTVLAGGVFVWHVHRVEARFARYRQTGLDAVKHADYVTGVSVLQNYLQRYPNDLDALSAYARARPKVELPNGEQIRQTMAALQQLVRLDPKRVDDWRELMEIYYDRQMSTEAMDAASAILALSPNDAEAERVKMGSLMRMRRYSDVQTLAQARIAADPRDWMTQIENLWALHELGHSSDELMAIADQAVQAYPKDQGALLLSASALGMANDFNGAAAQLRAAAKLPCTDKAVAARLIQQLDLMQMHSESLDVLRGLAKTGDADAQKALLRRYWEDGHVADVVQLCSTASPDVLNDPESKGIYADCLRRSGKSAQAAALSADLLGQHEVIAAAWNSVLGLQDQPSDHPPGSDQLRATRDACAAALARVPQDAYLTYYMGVAQSQLGDIESALALWQQAAKLSNTWALPSLVAAQTDLSLGRLDAAARATTEAYQRAPSSTSVAVTQAMVWYARIENGDTKTIVKLNDLIDEIQKYSPGEEQTLMMRVALLARQGQREQALQIARDILNRKPPISAGSLLKLANISRRWQLGMEDQCLALMQKQYGQTPNSVLSLALDDWQHQHGDAGAVRLQNAVDSAPADQLAAYRLAQATYLEATGDAGDLPAWTALGDQFPRDLSVQRAILASTAAYHDRAFYDRTINRVHDLLGDNSAVWKLARARWLLDGPNNPQATAQAQLLLKQILQHNPESEGANALMSVAMERSGDINGATDQLAAAQRLDPQSPAMALDLARLLQYRGDFDAARQQLDLLTKTRSSPDQLEQTAKMLANQGDVAKAIQIMQPLANAPDATKERKLNLASLYCAAGQFDSAQAICDKLMMDPDPAIVLMAAQIQMFKRNQHAADVILAKLDDLNFPPGGEDLAVGDFLYRFNRLPEALEHYRAAVKFAPHNLTYWLSLMDCLALMDRPADLLAADSDALMQLPDDNHLVGIQKQADLIQQSGPSPARSQLLSALVRDPSPGGPAVTTLRTMEDLQEPDVSIDDAAGALAKLSADLPRFAPAQAAVIQGQLRIGRYDDATQTAMRAAAAFPSDPLPAQLAVAALSATGNWDQALQMARTWRTRVIGDPLKVDLQIADIQNHLGDAAGALATLEPYQNALDVELPLRWQIQQIQAHAMVTQGHPDDAAAMLWDTARKMPQLRIAWMNFAATALPAPQAAKWLSQTADLLQKESDSDTQQVLLAQAWNMLAQRTGDKQYAQTARDLVRHLEQSPQAGATATLSEAIFAEQDGNPTAAQDAYRRALAKSDLPQADNNLAMLIAESNGDLTQAADLAQRAVKGDPNPDYYDTLAFVLGRQKNYAPAVAAMQSAVQLDPSNPKWRVHIAQLLLDCGKVDQAKAQIADLDALRPAALPPAYQKQLDDIRRQLASSASVSSIH